MDNALAKLDKATQMLAEVKTIDDAKKIVNLAEAARVYAREVELGMQAENHAAEIKLRAQRRGGEILMRIEKGAGRPSKNLSQPVTNFKQETYDEVGITRQDASRWQQIAQLPARQFDNYIETRLANDQPITTSGILREVKEQNRETRRDDNRAKVNATKPLEEVCARFSTITIDPPWDWGDEGDQDQLGRARPTYGTMTIGQLLDLPVDTLSDVDCHLYLWITNRSLPKGFALLEKWGFRYITCITWIKPSFGMGNYFRGQTEQILFGVKGSQMLKRKDASTAFNAPRGPNGHSSKPIEFYDFVESCSPGPYLEMFARSNREDWTSWGAEA